MPEPGQGKQPEKEKMTRRELFGVLGGAAATAGAIGAGGYALMSGAFAEKDEQRAERLRTLAKRFEDERTQLRTLEDFANNDEKQSLDKVKDPSIGDQAYDHFIVTMGGLIGRVERFNEAVRKYNAELKERPLPAGAAKQMPPDNVPEYAISGSSDRLKGVVELYRHKGYNITLPQNGPKWP